MAKFKTQATGQDEKLHSSQKAAFDAVLANAAADPAGVTEVWEWSALYGQWQLFERLSHSDLQTAKSGK